MTSWRWETAPVTVATPEFADQLEAEAWLTDSFGELLNDGVTEVHLYDGETITYSMPLTPS